MQSDENSFCGYVVLDSFNKAFWDEDNILVQINISKYVRTKMHTDYSSSKTQFYVFFDVMCCTSLNMHIPQSLLTF